MSDPNSNVYHFVWVQGKKGPWPQKWFGGTTDIYGKEKTYLQKHLISAKEFKLKLNELAQRYPYVSPPD